MIKLRTRTQDGSNLSRKEAAGPRELPLLGSSRALLKDNLAFVVEMARQYGDVAFYHMGPMPIYQVNHPDGVKRILQDNHRNYDKGAFQFPFMTLLLGNGLIMSEGDFWLRQRRLMQPTFHRKHIAGFGRMITEAAQATLARWRKQAGEDRPLDVHEEMVHLTLNIATQALFSTRVEGELDEVSAAISFLAREISFRFQVPFYPPPSIPTRRNRKFLRAVAVLERTIQQLIGKRRAALARGQAEVLPADLLSLLIQVQDEETGEGMSDKQLRDEVMTLFLAGHETTANLLSWAWYMLSQHAGVQRRLHAELDEVLDGRVPEAGDFGRLPYTRMVLEETLRLYPPAWISNRRSVEADAICGQHIPADRFIAFSPYVLHRLPEVWPNPEQFDPERFAPGAANDRPRFAYIPFGAGPHLCIGRDFALLEAVLVLATMAQQVELHLQPGARVRPQALATLRPRGGLPMTVHRRGA